MKEKVILFVMDYEGKYLITKVFLPNEGRPGYEECIPTRSPREKLKDVVRCLEKEIGELGSRVDLYYDAYNSKEPVAELDRKNLRKIKEYLDERKVEELRKRGTSKGVNWKYRGNWKGPSMLKKKTG